MADGLGRPELVSENGDVAEPGGISFRIRAEPSAQVVRSGYPVARRRDLDDRTPFVPDKPSPDAHEGVYTLSIAGMSGVRPVSAKAEMSRLMRSAGSGGPTMLIGIDRDAPAKPGSKGKDWLRAAGIVTDDGYGLFDFREVEIEPAE